VSSAFLIWDVIATARGDWAFNKLYLTGIYFWGLPIEEILFFLTVPYACIFIFKTVNLYLKDKVLKINDYILWLKVLLLIIIAVVNAERNYTYTVLLFSATSILLLRFLDNDLLSSRNFWITMLITYIPFLIDYKTLSTLKSLKMNRKNLQRELS